MPLITISSSVNLHSDTTNGGGVDQSRQPIGGTLEQFAETVESLTNESPTE